MAGRGPVVELDGLGDFRRTLRAAGDDLTDLKAANAEAAAVAAEGGRARVPSLSGRLSSSIRTTGTKTTGVIRAGRAAIPYAAPIHWGWPKRNIAANPFLTEGAQATEPKWLPAYLERIETILATVKGA